MLEVVDERFPDSFELTYRRFVDDTVILVDTKEQAESTERAHRKALAGIGLRPNLDKTKVMTMSEFTASLGREFFDELERVVTMSREDRDAAERRLVSVVERIEGDAPEVGGLRSRVLRRAYSVAGMMGSDIMRRRAVSDVACPALRSYALAYLESRPLNRDDVSTLRELFAEVDAPYDRIAVAATLASATLVCTEETVSELVSWAGTRYGDRLSEPGDGLAVGYLALVVYKHGDTAALERLDRWAADLRSPDARLSLLAAYVHRAVRPHDVRSVLGSGHDLGSELLMKLCDDAFNSRVAPIERVLRACVKTRYGVPYIPADRLPFLHILSEGAARGPDQAYRDAVMNWLRRGLDRHLYGDTAVERHLRACLERIVR